MAQATQTAFDVTTVVECSMTGFPDVTNSSTEGPPKYIQDLKQANKVIITVLLAFIMVAMGCVIGVDDFKRVLRRPVGVAIGFCSQFVVLPLMSFGIAHALQLKASFALGLLVTATCPGGTTSNLYTYWADGDVCLSITMTTLSTTVAMGMMPLNLFIYSRSWTEESAVIPFSNIAIALALILVPVAIGMLIKYKKPSWCNLVTKFGSIFGLLSIVVNIVLNGITNPSMFSAPWEVYFSAFIVPTLGYVFGYVFAFVLRRPHVECRTISFETGAQNISIALTLLLVSFEGGDLLNDLIVVPSLFGPFLLFDAMTMVGLYLAWKKWRTRSEEISQDDTEKCGSTAEGKMPLDEILQSKDDHPETNVDINEVHRDEQ